MHRIIYLLSMLSCLLGVHAQAPARLIIRGDDMGYTHSGNLALIESYKNGIEHSIEVIVASPWFPEAVKLLKQNPGVDVGVHLALTSEWENIKWRPLTNCTTLKDSNGYFFPMVYPNKNYPGKSISEHQWDITEIEKEFRAQIETALRNIPRITHISSHMGCVELNAVVKALVKRLAKEYHIDIDLEDFGVQPAHYKGPSTTASDKVQSFTNMIKDLQPGKTYLFLDHPGLNNEELKAVYHIGYENVAEDRQGVTDLFTDARVKAALIKYHVQVIGYNDLSKERKP